MRRFIIAMLSSVAFASNYNDIIRALEVDPKHALMLAEDRMDTELGYPAFDKLFAAAAMHSGEPEKAIFPLERVTAQYPNDYDSQIALASAYGQLNQHEASRLVLERIDTDKLSDATRKQYDAIEESVKRKERRAQATLKPRAWIGIGSDSNVNAATNVDSVDVPLLGSVTLDSSSRSARAFFSEAGFGLASTMPITQHMRANLDAVASGRAHDRNNRFDQNKVNVGGNIEYNQGKATMRIPVRQDIQTLDNAMYRRIGSYGLGFDYQARKNAVYQVQHQLARNTYPTDATQNTQTHFSSFSGNFISSNGALGSAQVFMSRDKARDDTGRHNSKHVAGASFYGSFTPNDWISPYGRLNYSHSNYEDLHPVFSKGRLDDFVGFDLGVNGNFTKTFGWNLELTYAKNYSNIAIFEYQRVLGVFKLKYEA